MKISLLCSCELHPVNEYLKRCIVKYSLKYQIELVRKKVDLSGGDILFLISCSEILNSIDRSAYRATLVLHASDLPQGRGWSPHIWQIINGAELITLSLIEAADIVDSGKIWAKKVFSVPKHALWNEINELLFNAEFELIEFAINEYQRICPVKQDCDVGSTFFPRRTLADSEIDPFQSIASQFNNIRVCDPNRFPAFFNLHGKKFKILLEKVNDEK